MAFPLQEMIINTGAKVADKPTGYVPSVRNWCREQRPQDRTSHLRGACEATRPQLVARSRARWRSRTPTRRPLISRRASRVPPRRSRQPAGSSPRFGWRRRHCWRETLPTVPSPDPSAPRCVGHQPEGPRRPSRSPRVRFCPRSFRRPGRSISGRGRSAGRSPSGRSLEFRRASR